MKISLNDAKIIISMSRICDDEGIGPDDTDLLSRIGSHFGINPKAMTGNELRSLSAQEELHESARASVGESLDRQIHATLPR